MSRPVTVKPTGYGFDSQWRRENIYLNLFFTGFEAKRGGEFCHSTHNASRIGRKWGTVCLNTRFPLPTLLCAGYSMKVIYFLI